MTDVHAAIGSAEVFESGVYLEPGNYPILWIEALKMVRNNDGHDVFIAEFHIIDSEVDARPKGTEVGWGANLTKHKSAPGNVRGFLANVTGIEITDVDADGSRAATSSDNPLRGTLVRCGASNTKTRSGGDFTVCKFERLSDEIQAKAEELHRNAGFSAPF